MPRPNGLAMTFTIIWYVMTIKNYAFLLKIPAITEGSIILDITAIMAITQVISTSVKPFLPRLVFLKIASNITITPPTSVNTDILLLIV